MIQCATAFAVLLVCQPASGQGTRADYQRAAELPRRASGKVFRADVRPNWLNDGRHFWYRVDTGPRSHEFVQVDAEQGIRQLAFDHAALARALRDQGVTESRADRLPLEDFGLDVEQDVVRFRIGGRSFHFHRQDAKLDEVTAPAETAVPLADAPVPQRSRSTGAETSIRFQNATVSEVEILWLDLEGRRRSYGKLAAGQTRDQHTFDGHAWWVVDSDGKRLAAAVAHRDLPVVRIDGQQRVYAIDAPARTERTQRERPAARMGNDQSPDGRWQAFYRDNNVWIRVRADDEEFCLTTDGSAEDAYRGRFHWSPDSQRLVVVRTRAADERKVYYIESAPRDQVQPKLHSYDYLKPGDRVAIDRPQLFHLETRQQIPISESLFENPWDIRDIRWSPDSSFFTFLYNQRGHQVLRIVAVDAATGDTRAIVEERSETFVDYSGKLFVQYLDATGEILWTSERDGWNHLYLIDAVTGQVKQQITKGPWVVRDVERVDAENRQVWFAAGGVRPEQDPYYLHYGRVNFDGSNLVWLTEGNGTHAIQFSPDQRWLIDTWSRVDSPPVTELRSADDGRQICVLEQADWSSLLEAGWRAPEPFVAKGRDGATDIYGVIFRPTNFDANGKYPVIEDIYAGPQSAFVPKRFSAFHRQQALAELGFVVVKIDGMGTSHRSKAFHDACWQNLGDAGFSDRIPWIRAAAAKYPSLDLDRVGIFGGSAGGQNALRGLLAHGDFYRVGVADCGCHDNRMDKIWWNEQWMGWPVGPHYADSSNVTHAHRLTGKLLLIVGEADRNVDPASTMQVVDALIRADKDFDLLVMPGVGHGAAETAYGNRRRQDFFVRHLLGVEPRREP
ncbi:MAG: DPP IV N-terminal domain-containing protein [Pirellulaceae bacterium]|nr:DPP IV N-terminal domain-containing protein [Pirellulaceae bacterium]